MDSVRREFKDIMKSESRHQLIRNQAELNSVFSGCIRLFNYCSLKFQRRLDV